MRKAEVRDRVGDDLGAKAGSGQNITLLSDYCVRASFRELGWTVLCAGQRSLTSFDLLSQFLSS